MRPVNCVIVYYSHFGNNEKLALNLKDRLNCDIHKVSEVKSRKTISILFDYMFEKDSKLTASDINLEKNDMIVFLSPVWASKIAAPLRTFIEKEKTHIKQYCFISLCNGIKGQRDKLIQELSAISGKAPAAFAELWINSLLPVEKQNKIKHTFNYRVSDNELKRFNNEIQSFIEVIKDRYEGGNNESDTGELQ